MNEQNRKHSLKHREVAKVRGNPTGTLPRAAILWRDLFFLIVGSIALRIIWTVESNSIYNEGDGSEEQTSTTVCELPQQRIIDSGFILTSSLHDFLSNNREWNDFFAALNSIMLVIPFVYVLKVTLWYGDYSLAFRLLATWLFRSLCGWFTYLPPDPSFLMSIYDLPEFLFCVFGSCEPVQDSNLPFVSFFSGHVASTVIIANHMYMRKYEHYGLALHVLNIFSMIRLLATRGHYSIDIIIGWVVAVYVSNPAERIGRFYSRKGSFRSLVPVNARDAFENFIGIYDVRIASQFDSADALYKLDQQGDNSTAQIASHWAQQNLQDLRREVEKHGIKIREIQNLQKMELIRLLQWAQMRMTELRAEADNRFNLTFREGQPRAEIISQMWNQWNLTMSPISQSDNDNDSNTE